MITFKCIVDNCKNKDIEYNFLGNPNTAECGGCGIILIGYDLREDPEITGGIELNG